MKMLRGGKVNQLMLDPEEFLNMLFKHTLHVHPFIYIKYDQLYHVIMLFHFLVHFLFRRPFGTEPEFFVQLFVEFDESLKVPTIEKLMKKMFKEQQISFAGVFPVPTLLPILVTTLQVPSKLLVQVPRYGKQLQTYKRIIPGIKFDTTPLLDSASEP